MTTIPFRWNSKGPHSYSDFLDKRNQVTTWLLDNIGEGLFRIEDFVLYILLDEDAIAFKLKFGNDLPSYFR